MNSNATAPPVDGLVSPVVSADIRRIVLVGFMGAGKTTVGRLLAAELGWSFLDLDAHVEARTGATVPELFARHGEAHFRRLESGALANAMGRSATVLALGGGTPEPLTNRLLLEQTPGTLVIFLAAEFPTLYDRCMLESFAAPRQLRPVLTTPSEAEARFQARQPIYRRVATHTIATDQLTAAQSIEAIVCLLQARSVLG